MTTTDQTNLVIPVDPFQKPTEGQVLAELQRLQSIWNDADAAKKTVFSFYSQTNDIWEQWHKNNPTAPLRPQYHSGKAVALIDTLVNSQLALHPSFKRRHLNDDQDTHDADDRIEVAVDSMFVDIFNWNLNIPSKVNGKQLALYNHTQAFLTLDNDAIQKPIKKTGETTEDFQRREWEWESRHLTVNPIKLEIPAPGELLMDPLKRIPDVSMRVKKIKAMDLLDKTLNRNGTGFGEVFDMVMDPYTELDLIERWTSKWIVFIVNGKMVFIEPNPLWIQPASQCWIGDVDAPPGEPFNPAQWVKQSIMWRVMPTAQFRDQSFVSQHDLLMDASHARRGFTGNPAEGARALRSDILPGRETDWWREKLPEFPNQILTEKAELDRDFEESTISRQAAGFREQGIRTATEFLSLAQNVNRASQSAVQQLGSLYTILGENSLRIGWRLSQEYPEEWQEISFGDNKLKIRDLGDPPRFHIRAKFEQVDIATALQEKASVDADLERGLIDEDTWFERSGYENVGEIKKNRVKDRIRRMPELLAEEEAIALREMGFEDLADRKDQEAKVRRLQGSLVNPQGQALETSQGNPLRPPVEAVP